MASSSSIVKVTTPTNDDFFLCRSFAKAISLEKLLHIIEQQPISIESLIEHTPPNDNVEMIVKSLVVSENNQWEVGDLCLCPYGEDGFLYKATIINIDSSLCTVSFDNYGNEETHLLTDLQLRTEEDEQESLLSLNEHDILPPLPSPPFPMLNPNDYNDDISSTLMSWYLVGYHSGLYHEIKEKRIRKNEFFYVK